MDRLQVFTIDTLLCFNHISVTKTCIKRPVPLAWREQRSLAELLWEVGSWRIVRSLLRGWARPSAAGSAEAELASSSSLRPGFIHFHLGSDLWLRLIQCVLSQKGANRDLEGLTYPHYRVQVVAIVTEKKLILSVRDSTDVDIHLVWVVTIGDLVVADPDIGYIVINVTHPHL